MIWAPDYKAEFERRLGLNNDLYEDPELRAQFMIYYAAHPVDWVNDWCVTFDPRKKRPDPKLMPFLLFARQVDFINFINSCLNDSENGLVEKSRDIGATWLACAFSVWLWIFHPGTQVGWGSRREDYVDKIGNPKAIFPKIRQILENLPRWMLPDGFRMSLHAPYMRIINPVNGAVIAGEAGDQMGRGGRTSIYFKDESAHYEHPELVEAALGDNTDVQIDMSSVNGSANVFYRRRMSGELWAPDRESTPGMVRIFVFDWSDNPLKTPAWYAARKAKAEREGLLHVFAQEVDRDYSGSVARQIIKAAWVRAAVDAHLKLNWKPDGMRVAGQDVADDGGDKNALVIQHGNIIRFADHWGGEADEAAYIAVPACVELKVDELYYDSVGVGSGFKTGIKVLRDRNAIPKRLRIQPWNGGGGVLDPEDPIIVGDNESPTNEDQYANIKAQGWFRLRARFYKTFLAVTRGEKFDPSELISIDSRISRLHELQMELTQAVHKYNLKGKTIVDKKPEGALSPNLADAVVIAYTPTRELSIFDVL